MGVRTVRVSANFILEMSKVGTRQACECVEGVPNDAKIIGIQCDPARNAFVMFLESPQWADSQVVEEVEVVFERPEDECFVKWLERRLVHGRWV